ncbi:hypothetical protein BLL52_1157 [Rhodoferax antarcticus ANT.BR]|uniref:Uncharacterized protein n=1 Tax=Rhodoferax antarcticus ANT.BR TaxID=1111071 RepID=A0A1Q8YH89_9BURK|nr:hypothetical protein BLL52_1157 [Rhodoferax antarcticus ANT.BR]
MFNTSANIFLRKSMRLPKLVNRHLSEHCLCLCYGSRMNL